MNLAQEWIEEKMVECNWPISGIRNGFSLHEFPDRIFVETQPAHEFTPNLSWIHETERRRQAVGKASVKQRPNSHMVPVRKIRLLIPSERRREKSFWRTEWVREWVGLSEQLSCDKREETWIHSVCNTSFAFKIEDQSTNDCLLRVKLHRGWTWDIVVRHACTCIQLVNKRWTTHEWGVNKWKMYSLPKTDNRLHNEKALRPRFSLLSAEFLVSSLFSNLHKSEPSEKVILFHYICMCMAYARMFQLILTVDISHNFPPITCQLLKTSVEGTKWDGEQSTVPCILNDCRSGETDASRCERREWGKECEGKLKEWVERRPMRKKGRKTEKEDD